MILYNTVYINYSVSPSGRRRYVAEFRRLRRNHSDQYTEESVHMNCRNAMLATVTDIAEGITVILNNCRKNQ